jgi:Peptidase family M28
MHSRHVLAALCGLIAGFAVPLAGQQTGAAPQAPAQAQTPPPPDDIKTLVERLDLEKYKATIKGLTQFGDRRQGTARNLAAVGWIEAQLKSYGCPTERIKYEFTPRAGRGNTDAPAGDDPAGGRATGAGAAGTAAAAAGGERGAGQTGQPAAGQGGQRGRGQGQGAGRGRTGQGGSTLFGNRARTGVNNDPNLQPDEKLRELNREPAPTGPGPREEVFCTKVGTTHPEEMYIIGGHMDGHGWGEAANDDGSGSAIVMELARIFSSPDVQTERTIRFALWNNEETGTNGAFAYIAERQALQGKENPPGSGTYPEPTWLGMIQHDMMLFDHGMPDKDGKVSPEQRPEADVNIEFAMTSKMSDGAMKLAWAFKAANDKYATDYPATVGPHMTNTDSRPFQDIIPAISLRENERGMQIGAGWDPHWHQPTDVYSTFSDKDFRLGLNAAQTTLAAVAQLTGMKLKK